MPKTVEEAADEHVEAVKEKEYRESVSEMRRKLAEMESILGPQPELRAELEALEKGHEEYLSKYGK